MRRVHAALWRTVGPLALLLLPVRLAAQDSTAAAKEKDRRPARLFRNEDTVPITIKGDLKPVIKDRDTLSTKTYPATLSYKDEKGEEVTLNVQLATRGHFRLKSSVCSFPPIKVIFDKGAVKGTLFSGQGSLKLTTHCQNSEKYEQNVLLEHAIYKLYNLFTDFSHRARLVHVSWINTTDTTKNVTKYGFFLEDDDEMARRNGGKIVKQTGGRYSDMDPELLDLVAVFEYLIGNTDFSIYAIHNFRLVQVEGKELIYPVAYDWDFSGIIAPPYALPDYRLPIKSVRTRLYRGSCREIDKLVPTLELFNAKKDSVYAVFAAIKDLDPKRLKDVNDYLAEFYKTMEKPKKFDSEMGYACSQQR